MHGRIHSLIYTSAPHGLAQGSHGFCTVARSRDLPESLIAEIEARSRYENWKGARPTVHRFHPLTHRGRHYFILSRIVFAGTDYSHRANHLAHHLIIEGSPAHFSTTPSSILSSYSGFLDRYGSSPQWLDSHDATKITQSLKKLQPLLPAKHWEAMTQASENAAAWIEATTSDRTQPLVLITDKQDTNLILRAFNEASALLPPPLTWDLPFTTFFQESDLPTPYRWVGGISGSPVEVFADRHTIQREHLSPAFSLKCQSSLLKAMAQGSHFFVAP